MLDTELNHAIRFQCSQYATSQVQMCGELRDARSRSVLQLPFASAGCRPAALLRVFVRCAFCFLVRGGLNVHVSCSTVVGPEAFP